MTIYIDLLFFLNIGLDFVLLMSVSVILKRNVSLFRIFLGSLLGGVTIFTLFVSISGLWLLLLKLFLGIFMVIITFGYRNITYTFNNFYYLILMSIILGGGLYLIKDTGFYNYYVLITLFILFTIAYVKISTKHKNNYNNYYKVDIYIKGKLYKLNGYLDTGNKLYDNYHNRPIILISYKIDYQDSDLLYVPYAALNNVSILKCIKTDKIVINNHIYKNYLVGLSKNKFMIDGINCILHSSMQENINDK